MAKPRVIVSSDIGGADPDDMQSMAHVLVYADQLDIKALISTPTAHGGRAHHIHKALDAYSKDYAKLATWGDYPNPGELKSIVHQGAIKVPGKAGFASPTSASKAIIKEAHEAKAAGDPLWVMTWGALTDVAQALHDDPSISSAIRILASNGWNWKQDPNSYHYILNNHKSVWMIDSLSTHRGIWVDSGGGPNNGFKLNEVKGHGALGDYFYNARPWGLKAGDSWSIAYLTDNADNNNPGANSWGGTYYKNGHGPNYYTDDKSPAFKVGPYPGAKHVREHQKEIYNDMYKHFDRAKFAKAGANPDDPVIANNDSGVTKKDIPLVLKVLMNDKALDGGLKIASADATTAKGGKVVVNSDGTLKYTPKAGFVGDDTFKYKAKDADGDTDTANVTLKVQAPTSNPAPTPPPPPKDGGDDPVIAKDDVYKLDAGKTLWVNTRYFTWNDTGKDGGLKVTDVADVSENGVSISWGPSGTLVYTAKPGFAGTDRVEYTVVDKDGDSDTAHLVLNIGKGSVTPPPATEKPIPPKGGTNHSVIAVDDVYKSAQGKDLFVNTKYLVKNDKGLDGGLKVIAMDKVSKYGADVSLSSNGTVNYDPSDWFRGTDRVNYTVVDKDGSLDIGTVVIHVG